MNDAETVVANSLIIPIQIHSVYYVFNPYLSIGKTVIV